MTTTEQQNFDSVIDQVAVIDPQETVSIVEETASQETQTVDVPVLPTNSIELQEILNNPDLTEDEKLKAINELNEQREAEMKKAFEQRDPEAVRRMMLEMQAMVKGLGVNNPNLFGDFKLPKFSKPKVPNEAVQSAAEAKRARKAAKNLAIIQKKALTKV